MPQAIEDEAGQVTPDESKMTVNPALLLLILTVLSVRKVACYTAVAKEPRRRSLDRKLDPQEHVFGQMSGGKELRRNQFPRHRHAASEQMAGQAKAGIAIRAEVVLDAPCKFSQARS